MTDRRSRTALLGLGGNVGDVLGTLRSATVRLARELGDVAVSAVYRTPAEGGARQSDYLNAAARIEVREAPTRLLEIVGLVEAEAGRDRPFPGAPRTLDVDILFMGDLIVSEPELTLPHPRWSKRDFVVVPLLDVAADWIDPVTGKSVRDVAEERGWSTSRFPIVAGAGALDAGRET